MIFSLHSKNHIPLDAQLVALRHNNVQEGVVVLVGLMQDLVGVVLVLLAAVEQDQAEEKHQDPVARADGRVHEPVVSRHLVLVVKDVSVHLPGLEVVGKDLDRVDPVMLASSPVKNVALLWYSGCYYDILILYLNNSFLLSESILSNVKDSMMTLAASSFVIAVKGQLLPPLTASARSSLEMTDVLHRTVISSVFLASAHKWRRFFFLDKFRRWS